MLRPRASLGALGLAVVSAASAQAPARDLAATCAACHSAPLGTPAAPPPLAGMPPAALRAALAGFAAGTREATVMPKIAKGLTPVQVEQLAAWFTALTP